MSTFAVVALLGALGAATRFVVDGTIRTRWTHVFPVATFVVNVTGSLAIGLLTGASLFHGWGGPWLVGATVGFCGGYTTFSTAMVETVRLVQAEDHRRAAAYAAGSLGVCLAAAAVGVLSTWLVR